MGTRVCKFASVLSLLLGALLFSGVASAGICSTGQTYKECVKATIASYADEISAVKSGSESKAVKNAKIAKIKADIAKAVGAVKAEAAAFLVQKKNELSAAKLTAAVAIAEAKSEYAQGLKTKEELTAAINEQKTAIAEALLAFKLAKGSVSPS